MLFLVTVLYLFPEIPYRLSQANLVGIMEINGTPKCVVPDKVHDT